MPEPFTALIMAAGKGTRMRSSVPKVLHPVCGRPMVEWVIEAARAAGAEEIVCITRPGDGVAEVLPVGVTVVEQTEGEGTGSAVLTARNAAPAGPVVILSGDQPLIGGDLIAGLIDAHDGAATLLTTEQLDPAGYGRIVRAPDGSVKQIVETKDPSGVAAEHLAIREVNLGTYVFDAERLWAALDQVGETAGERYLTDVFPRLGRVTAHPTDDAGSALGINDRADLMDAERAAQQRILREHARNGVSFEAPDSIRVEAGVEIGGDTVIGAATTLRGKTRIGSRCSILSSFLVDATVEDGASVGPFAYLRPGTHVGEGAKIGTFVEVKNSDIGAGAKVPHLSYLGDADVGEGANVAAGNITANYDGFEKHRTRIGKRARTGVDTSFVAPVTVGEGAYTGAGSVIGEDVPDGALGISRPAQKNIEGYAERKEKERE